MTSSFTLDISGLGQQVATAITAGMTKIQEEIVKAVGRQQKAKEADLAGVQGLLLENAYTLFPLYFGLDETVPDLRVVILGSGTTICAAVVYSFSRENPERYQ